VNILLEWRSHDYAFFNVNAHQCFFFKRKSLLRENFLVSSRMIWFLVSAEIWPACRTKKNGKKFFFLLLTIFGSYRIIYNCVFQVLCKNREQQPCTHDNIYTPKQKPSINYRVYENSSTYHNKNHTFDECQTMIDSFHSVYILW